MRSRCRIGRRLAVLAGSVALVAVAPASAAGIEVKGRVLDDAGRPARGATVELTALLTHYQAALAAWRGEADPAPAARTATDPGGMFSLQAPEAGFWKVTVRASGFVAAEYPLEPLLEEAHLADLVLIPDAGVEVKVVRAPASSPPPTAGVSSTAGGATFAAWVEAASTGGRDSEPYAGGFWRAARRVTRAPALPATVHLSRRAGEAVEIRVAAPRGGLPAIAATDREGRVAAPDGIAISAGPAASPAAAPSGVANPGVGNPALALAILRVTEDNGAAIAGALVCASNFGLPLGMTNAEGRVEIPAPPAVTLDLVVLTSAGPARRFTVRPEQRRDGVATLMMRRAEPLVGTVIDDGDAKPVPAGWVWAKLQWRDNGPAGLPDSVLGDLASVVRSDAAGRFDLRAAAGTQVRAMASGYQANEVLRRSSGLPGFAEAPAPRDRITVRLKKARWVSGVVVDASSRPVAGALVTPFGGPAQGFNTERSTTDAQGRFRLGVSSPSARIVALARGYAPTVEPVDLGERASRDDLRIVLQRGRRVHGRVVDLEEKPVASARVRLAETAPRGGGQLGLAVRKSPALVVSTGADGAFEIAGVATGIYDFTIDAAGYAITSVPGLEIAQGEGDSDLGTFMVGPGVVIEGLVVDRGDDPLAGALVTIFAQGSLQRIRESAGPEPWSAWLSSSPSRPAATESDAEGRFVLRDVNPSEKVDLFVSLEGYMPSRVPRVGGPTEEPVRVVLEAAAAMSGRVVDEEGEPVAGSTVTASGVSMPDRKSTRGDDEGAFELAKLQAGSWRLEAAAAGYELIESPTVDLKGGEAKEGVLITMRGKEHGTVDGRVVDEDGAAVAGAQVMAADASARTGDDGAFHLERVALGTQEIRAVASGSRSATKTLEVREGVNTVELMLEGGVEVSGRVVDQDGNGVVGAAVSLMAAGAGGSGQISASGGFFRIAPRSTRSTGGGAFLLPDVADGVYALQAVLAGQSRARWPGELRVAGSPVQGLELVLEKGGVIQGALQGLDFDQLSQVRIMAGSERGGGPGRVIGSEYEIANLEPGEYRVTGEVREHGLHAEGRVTVEAGGQARLDLDFEGGLTLSGVVTRRGEPAVGSMLSLRGIDVAVQRNATIDFAGDYLLRGLEPGIYELTVRAAGQGARVPWTRRIEIRSDTEVAIELGGGRVTGVVVDASSGDPLAGATVRMRRVGGASGETFFGDERRTGAAGEFAYDDVPEGAFAVEATAEGYATGSVAVEVRADAEVDGVVLELDPSSGLSLRVTAASGPPPWVLVMVIDRASRPVSAPMRVSPTGSARLYEVPGVAEGSWGLLVGSPGLATVRLEVVVPGPPVDVVLTQAAGLAVEIPALLGTTAVADLVVLDAAGRPFLTMDGRSGFGVYRVESGRAFVDGMPAGQWTLRARSADGSSWSGVATTAPGSTSQTRLQ